MRLSDFQYDLPRDRIAKYPARPRDASRLLLLPGEGQVRHHRFRELPSLLRAGDLMVVNDTRVVPARLIGRRAGGGEAEVLLLRPAPDGLWEAMVRPGRRLRPGAVIHFGEGGSGVEVVESLPQGRRLVRAAGASMHELMDAFGHVPLPPYIERPDEPPDRRRYQTVYARKGCSVAAPTAGLHFTPRILRALAQADIRIARVRLDVGPGTFKPVTSERVEDHRMDPEPYFIPEETAGEVNAALRDGRRVLAIGTTAARALEDQGVRRGRVAAGAFETDLFIRPGFPFRVISGLLTNFHLPGSTLIMLVSALAGRERVLAAYREAVESGYRFYSYGDAMLVWGSSEGKKS